MKTRLQFTIFQPLLIISLLFVLVYGNLFAQTFTKITSGDIVSGSSWSNGWGDYDNDGDLDLFANLPDTSHLYNNNGDGSFTRINQGTLATEGFGGGITWGDYDNDGYLDLFTASGVTTFGGGGDSTALLFHNSGDGTFTKIIFADTSDFAGASWGDYDNDGDLDLFVASGGASPTPGVDNFLYRNEGNGNFSRITTGEIVNDGGNSINPNWVDYDNDDDLDLFVCNGNFQNNFLYSNNGDGSFTKITTGDIVNDGGTSLGSSWGDFDNDGDLDLFVANLFAEVNFLYQNDGSPAYTFTRITVGDIVNDTSSSIGSTWGDFDNDGDLDLFVANEAFQNNDLYSNNGDGTFTKITSGSIVKDTEWSLGTSSADYDNDGDLDIFVSNVAGNNSLYSNNGNANSWININCVGTVSNRSAIGAKVRVKANIFGNDVWQLKEISGRTGYATNSLNAEFGLGDATIIDSLKIEWPLGIIETYTDIAVDQFITAIENGGITGIDEETFNFPHQFELSQNYPNPFNPSTNIKYRVPETGFVKLSIYSVLGEEVAVLVDGLVQAGFYEVTFDASDLPSGTYIYRLQNGNTVQAKKMLMMK
ncbi:MAG: VCBS repeat-containing protein [Bacteroidetes bacterium]|nr:VCBS repeat-containing protein [Bacteroidota bacterium]